MIWLIGAGNMAVQYAKVLNALNREFLTIGRRENSATLFMKETGHFVETGGLKTWLEKRPEPPECAIVSVGVEALANISIQLMEWGVKKILLEKPGGLNRYEIFKIKKVAEINDADINIAYNRRFYASVFKAIELIEEDGGVLSIHFEFTELVQKITNMTKYPGIKENWFFGNSTHVVDLAFFLGGKPDTISVYHKGGLYWHPSASIFAGSGVTKTGALFSYSANWEAPGRWGIEVMTRSRRLILQPLEQLYVQDQGSFERKLVTLDNALDKKFKPGLFKMVEDFLNGKLLKLVSIDEQSESINNYDQMANYL